VSQLLTLMDGLKSRAHVIVMAGELLMLQPSPRLLLLGCWRAAREHMQASAFRTACALLTHPTCCLPQPPTGPTPLTRLCAALAALTVRLTLVCLMRLAAWRYVCVREGSFVSGL
jgi:hypothetical protein